MCLNAGMVSQLLDISRNAKKQGKIYEVHMYCLFFHGEERIPRGKYQLTSYFLEKVQS